ncbi:MAG: hypothetical protein HYZ53_04195 [Planctomycetes bacterium]|nr:hypothetical protein [Planctomycetota bacterium]
MQLSLRRRPGRLVPACATFAAAVAAVAPLAILPARSARAGDQGSAAAKELAALVKESEQDGRNHKEAYLAFKERFERFAEAHRGTEEGLSAKLWLLGNTWWHREEGTMEKRAAALADEILRDHAASKQLAKLPDFHYDFAPADRERIFRSLLDTSPHPEVRGEALLRIAVATRGPERQPLLTRLLKEFGEVPHHYTTLGAMAEALLAPHDPASLAVGKHAPEIEGRTPDGKPLKLSDFKGKVVVLDFFGDW